MNLVCKNYSVCALGLRANSGMLGNSEEMSDARTLQCERRELQVPVDCFVTSVFSPDTSDKNEPSQSAYDTLKSNLITLDNNASHVLQEGDELRDFCDKLKKLGQSLDDAYRCWCDNTVTSPYFLPYFLTTQSKPRVVYDGSATYEGRSINSCIHSGPDLLNSLANVLAKFRMGQYALMADITKCFFQISLPEHQQDLFRIFWFKDDDISKGQLQPY